MALDGFKILESDLGIDTQNAIFDLYDKKKSEQEIISFLHSERDKISDAVDVEIFISASCLSLWQIGICDNILYNELESIVQNGANIFWQESFDRENFEKRSAELKNLLIKVRKPNNKVRPIKDYKQIENTLFSKGDVLALNFGENYGCVIFEDFYQYRKDAYYSFVVTTYKQKQIPTIDEILLEEIPITKTKTGETGIRKLSVLYSDIAKMKSCFIKIGSAIIDCEAENLGFSQQICVENISELENKIENILEGHKIEFYVCYTV
jgi:hypothetical protein